MILSSLPPKYKKPLILSITDLRIKLARELLHSDYINITNIAEQVGYENVYHFSKVFKQKTGYSPLNYLKNKIEGTENRSFYTI